MTLLPSTAAMVTVGPVSATVTVWVAVAVLPLTSVTTAETVAVPLASAVASVAGMVALQAVPVTVAVSSTPVFYWFGFLRVLPSSPARRSAGLVSATVTVWVAVAVLPLTSV